MHDQCQQQGSIGFGAPRQKISKVSALVYPLRKVTGNGNFQTHHKCDSQSMGKMRVLAAIRVLRAPI
jgi:hypothetical protein